MSVIYMIHPTHGAKVAISEHEAIQDEMFGWSRYEPEPAPSHPLDHDGDGRPGGSPAGENATRRRGRRRAAQEE
jgi:hypothetical protein